MPCATPYNIVKRHKIVHQSHELMVAYYVSLYYYFLEKDPTIRQSNEVHIDYISEINKKYLSSLRYANLEPDTRLTDKIEFLTQVFSKQRTIEKKLNEKREISEMFAVKRLR